MSLPAKGRSAWQFLPLSPQGFFWDSGQGWMFSICSISTDTWVSNSLGSFWKLLPDGMNIYEASEEEEDSEHISHSLGKTGSLVLNSYRASLTPGLNSK